MPLFKTLILAFAAVLAANTLALGATTATTQSCANLASLSLPGTTITAAESVSAGSFTPPPASGAARPLRDLPAFCRVAATLTPTSDSDIKIEVWLPTETWNGNFQAVGNGGWGGALEYSNMAEALRRGYATSSTDDGHSGDSGSFVLGHPEKFIDFAYRSEHEMTLKAKALIDAFYGKAPHYSYWNGCSGGGREGLIQAHRYPDEFEGVVAGDPATFKRNAWAIWLANATFKDPAAYIPPSKYPMIHQAVLDACDKLDGLKDGLIDDPRVCHFDPKVLLCKGEDTLSCLTARQVQTAQTILSPMKSSNGTELFPRLEPGTELRWGRLAGGPEPAALFLDYFKYVVHKDPNWDWRTFDLDRDSSLADEDAKGVVALDPDLSAFEKHGGKLLIYHGWADQQVAPEASIEFYQAMGVMETTHPGGTNVNTWARLFMVPGMAHCSGGEGPDTFDKVGAIEQWVEKGKAPDQIVAAHTTNRAIDRTRPLCPYPQQAQYKGSGSFDEAANFVCQAPRVSTH
jgi:feruloyl esterase